MLLLFIGHPPLRFHDVLVIWFKIEADECSTYARTASFIPAVMREVGDHFARSESFASVARFSSTAPATSLADSI